ncbi:MAG: HAMP domain-containing histidine kinase [Oscillospiraceae bacterium]|nr:HAMP domain-containing histidine kinase [Oscillospiraceae bacterium]
MKRLVISLAAVTLLFLSLALLWLFAVPKLTLSRINARSVTVNRLNSVLENEISEGKEPEASVAELLTLHEAQMPDEIKFLSGKNTEGSVFSASGGGGNMICPVHKDEEIIGFAVYTYSDPLKHISDVLVLSVLAFCWLAATVFLIFIYINILKPFVRLSEYPERIAKMPDTDKLPETRNRRFGKFIWSMNMLRDVLINERNRSERLEGQRRTLLASVAHGVKTPVTNIRLYAEAIKTGLYSENGSDNAALAEKIDRNAEKIQSLVKELIETSASAASSYTPEITSFYISEMAKIISGEYTERMNISHIPFAVECRSEHIMNSDLYGLVRIVSQLIENAVKYGNGEGIKVSIESDPDGVCISVRNKGELLPEEELLFIFDSFRRGSNSHDVEGSGIGLFTARTIASALGGSVAARRLEDSGEMEFTVYIPD